jgi:hypothetical protein
MYIYEFGMLIVGVLLIMSTGYLCRLLAKTPKENEGVQCVVSWVLFNNLVLLAVVCYCIYGNSESYAYLVG